MPYLAAEKQAFLHTGARRKCFPGAPPLVFRGGILVGAAPFYPESSKGLHWALRKGRFQACGFSPAPLRAALPFVDQLRNQVQACSSRLAR
jgi:hypothetical protein